MSYRRVALQRSAHPTPRRSPAISLLWIAVIAALALVVVTTRSWLGSATPGRVASVGTGPREPNLSLLTIDGQRFSLAEQRGRPVVLYFMASWCTSCLPEAQALARVYQEYRNRGLQVLAVDVESDDTTTELARFQRLVPNGDYLWAIDTVGDAVRAFQVRALDTTVVIDPEGSVAYRDEVPTPYPTLKQVIEQVLR